MAQRALITGATAGIGNSFARALAARGFDLVLVARDGERLQSVAEELSSVVAVEVLVADLTVDADLALVEKAVEGVDLLVNNAGASLKQWFGTSDIADEDRQLDLLVRAPMRLMDVALKAMTGQDGAQATGSGIINVASVAAFTPRGTYSAHKAWLVNLSRWAHIQYGPAVRVMALCPGFVHTEFHQRMGVDKGTVPGWMWLNSDAMVAEALADYDKGKAISIPSKRYKVLATVARFAPMWLVAKVAKKGR